MEQEKERAKKWFETLKNRIKDEFITIEKAFDNSSTCTFESEKWSRDGGGGGEMNIMFGNVFEKVGVNVSTVHGEFSPEFGSQIPGAHKSGNKFWASGISLVSHMKSPIVPTVHMNTRMIITENYWFGGGTDLTPTYYNENDKVFFHAELEKMCNKHDKNYYAKFSKWADEYFFIKHRKEPRGIGGIFYDYVNSSNFDRDFDFTKDVGETFLKIYPQIVRMNMCISYTKEQKEFQLEKRGRYVEFNLLWDRGTKFGIMTGGNPKAVLMSLPPCAKWVDF